MKRYISILSLLVVAFGINAVRASECFDEDCDINDEIIVEEIVEESTDDADILLPAEPMGSLWVDDDFSYDIAANEDICFNDYNCPFDTEIECKVWATKPVHNESVAPRAAHLNPVKTDGILATLTFMGTIDANDELAEPLLERYQILMRASNACCVEGIIHKMLANGANNKKIYNFLQQDASDFIVGSRCLVMQDGDIARNYSYGVTGNMVETVRNTCLCKNKQWFDSLLQPFFDLYQLAPDFQYMPFYYTYLDNFQRETTVSVNADVQTVMEMLQYCPD